MAKNRENKERYNNYGTKRGATEYDLDKDQRDVNTLIKGIHMICNVAGFRVENRIVLKNKETGKYYE